VSGDVERGSGHDPLIREEVDDDLSETDRGVNDQEAL
jgi:hypothetical protein